MMNGFDVDRWAKLFAKVQTGAGAEPDPALAATEQASAPSQDRAPTASEFDQWCMRITIGVMDAFHARVLKRSEEFEQQAGRSLTVVYPAEAPVPHLVYAAREMQFMKIGLDGTDVHVYSARNPGKLPVLHLVRESERMLPGVNSISSRQTARELTRQRVVSTPLCRVATFGAGYQLVSPKDGAPLKLDELVYRVFEELVKQRRMMRRT